MVPAEAKRDALQRFRNSMRQVCPSSSCHPLNVVLDRRIGLQFPPRGAGAHDRRDFAPS